MSGALCDLCGSRVKRRVRCSSCNRRTCSDCRPYQLKKCLRCDSSTIYTGCSVVLSWMKDDEDRVKGEVVDVNGEIAYVMWEGKQRPYMHRISWLKRIR